MGDVEGKGRGGDFQDLRLFLLCGMHFSGGLVQGVTSLVSNSGTMALYGPLLISFTTIGSCTSS